MMNGNGLEILDEVCSAQPTRRANVWMCSTPTVVIDGFKPDRYDIGGAMVCLVGVAVIMFAPR